MAKATKFNTFAGVAIYPKTSQAMRWDEKLNRSVPDPTGAFEMDLAFDPGPAVDKLKAIIKECAAEAKVKPKNVPFKAETNEEGEETGRILFKFKQYGTDRDGNERRIPHFDAKARPLGSDFRLTSGSTVKIAGRPQAYKQLGGGVRFLMDSIQVIKYVEFENNPFADESGEDAEQENTDNAGETSANEEPPFDVDDSPADF